MGELLEAYGGTSCALAPDDAEPGMEMDGADLDPAATYKDLQSLFGRRIRADVIREHWDEALRRSRRYRLAPSCRPRC